MEVGRRQTDRPRLEFWRGADQFGGRIMTRLSLLAYCTLTRGRYLAGDIRIDSTSELTRGRLIWRGGIDDSTHVASMRTHPLMLADREPRPASINHQHYLRSMVVLLHQPPKANQPVAANVSNSSMVYAWWLRSWPRTTSAVQFK